MVAVGHRPQNSEVEEEQILEEQPQAAESRMEEAEVE
jgi:hypothetical protein